MSKPAVDRLEAELEGEAQVLRVNAMTRIGATLAGRYGVRGVPAFILFDGHGQIVYARSGPPDKEAITAWVEQLAASSAPE